MSELKCSSNVWRWATLVFACVLVGCSGVAQEDRTIVFSNSGETVAFQHGDDGVYSATEAGETEKIYELQPGELLASTPHYRPGNDDEFVFCVARVHKSVIEDDANSEEMQAILGDWDQMPSGRVLLPIPIEYTCYIKQTSESEPQLLFTASANHLGVVGTNMAVKFSPDGESLLFADMNDSGGMLLKRYSLASNSQEVLWDRPAHVLAFEHSPSGQYLACAALGLANGGESLLAIRSTDSEERKDWGWQMVNDSLPLSGSFDHLAMARSSLPVFNADDSRLAYVRVEKGRQQNGQSGKSLYKLFSRVLTGHTDESLWESEYAPADIHWHPGEPILVWRATEADDRRSIKLFSFSAESLADFPLANLTDEPIDRFVGFSPSGKRLAFTTFARSDQAGSSDMLVPGSLPRNSLFLLEFRSEGEDLGADAKSLKPVLEDVRLTFVNWSPSQEKLSGWGTYVDTHRSIGGALVERPETPGDPPFVYDAESQTLEWLPTSPLEKAYVGYYCLLHQENQEAAKWFVQSENAQTALGKSAREQTAAGEVQGDRQAWPIEALRAADQHLFESVCHKRLGNDADARLADQLWTMVRSTILTNWLEQQVASEAQSGADGARAFGAEDQQARIAALIEMSAALRSVEVFVGLGDYAAGAEHLAELESQATTAEGRFVAAACAADLAKMMGDVEAYEMALGEEVLPAFLAIERSNAPASSTPGTAPSDGGVVEMLCDRMLLGSAAAILEPVYSQSSSGHPAELSGELAPEQIEVLKVYRLWIESLESAPAGPML